MDSFMGFVVNHWPGLVAGYFVIGIVFTIWLFIEDVPEKTEECVRHMGYRSNWNGILAAVVISGCLLWWLILYEYVTHGCSWDMKNW